MAFKVPKLQMLRGSLARRFLLMLALAVAIVSLLRLISDDDDVVEIFPESTDDCDVGAASGQRFFPGRFLKPVTFYPFPLAEPPSSSCTDLTASIIFRELRDRKILNPGARALCVGAKAASDASVLQELGFKDALAAVGPHLFPSLARKGLAYKIIAFEDDSFDFAFSRSSDSAAVLVLEMERVLKPGGFGVVLIPSMSRFSTMKLEAPISSLLKSSSIAHVYEEVDAFTLVAFKKQAAVAAAAAAPAPTTANGGGDDDTEHSNELYHHTGNCRSVVNNKDFMGSLEPLDREKSKSAGALLRGFSYLPDFVDISARERLMFIEIGAGRPYANSSIANWFLPCYPAKSRTFDIYAVDGDVSLGTSYAGRPGITFVHFPGLLSSESEQRALLPADEVAFDIADILDWFNKTAARGDFVVLKMNAGGRTGLALLRKLLKDGGLCLVDELFLHCPSSKSGRDTLFEDCLHVLEALRNSGAFAHLW